MHMYVYVFIYIYIYTLICVDTPISQILAGSLSPSFWDEPPIVQELYRAMVHAADLGIYVAPPPLDNVLSSPLSDIHIHKYIPQHVDQRFAYKKLIDAFLGHSCENWKAILSKRLRESFRVPSYQLQYIHRC